MKPLALALILGLVAADTNLITHASAQTVNPINDQAEATIMSGRLAQIEHQQFVMMALVQVLIEHQRITHDELDKVIAALNTCEPDEHKVPLTH